MDLAELRAPFPWFGGKGREQVASLVWTAFGHDVNNYVEPFAGSIGMLLRRPGGPGKIETVNDINRYIVNFWRAIAQYPEETAAWCDWPVNEADMHARHEWLIDWGLDEQNRTRLHRDPFFCDAQAAGWWVWGQCIWIGGGWCAEGSRKNHKHPKLDGIGKGVHSDKGHGVDRRGDRQRPFLSHAGQGVHSEKGAAPRSPNSPAPMLFGIGRGVHSGRGAQQLPKISVTDGAASAGGVHSARLPSIGNDRGINGVASPPALEWFHALAVRLRRTRVVCGAWKRVLSPSSLGKGKQVGGRRPCAVFLDPPYAHSLRDTHIYADDDASLSREVREWALKHGDDPELRIALCGLEGEHDMPNTWRKVSWTGGRGYAKEGNENRKLERVWLSPHCLPLERAVPQLTLFEGG